MKYIIALFIALKTFSFQVEMPKIEALVYKVNALDITQTKDYFFEIDFYQPLNQVFVRIFLRDIGIEDLKQRDALAERIVTNIRTINKEIQVPKLSVKVLFNESK